MRSTRGGGDALGSGFYFAYVSFFVDNMFLASTSSLESVSWCFTPALTLCPIGNINTPELPIFQHAVKVYECPTTQRDLIREENKDKAGVYAWVNMVNGKFYIGSGDCLYSRLSDYYPNWYLLSRTSLYICRALTKYGMSNFRLLILEYTNSENVISCEYKNGLIHLIPLTT